MSRFKPLYNDDYESMNNDGHEVWRRLHTVIAPVLKKLCDEGYSMRDVEGLAFAVVASEVSYDVLTRNMKLHEKEKHEREALRKVKVPKTSR